jgi:hypothetical protein
MQSPLPPGLPDMTFVAARLFELVSQVVAAIAIVVGLKFALRSPLGEAWAERFRERTRRRFGGSATDPGSDRRVAGMEEELTQLRGEVAELAERLDFAERLLSQHRQQQLGAGQ